MKKYFFHADTEKYRRRLKSMLIIVLVPLFMICVFCTVNIVLNLRVDTSMEFVALMLGIIAGCVFMGMTFSFVSAYFTEKLKRRHSKYTYFDIIPGGMVYSLYAGEFTRYGKRIIMRRLFYIPFSGLEEVSRDPKTDPEAISFKGSVREYFLASDELGYHVNEEGEIAFDHPELDTRGYEERNSLVISGRLGRTKALLSSVEFYREQYVNRPEKKPFNIADYVSKKKKRVIHTSNPELEAPSFNRKW